MCIYVCVLEAKSTKSVLLGTTKLMTEYKIWVSTLLEKYKLLYTVCENKKKESLQLLLTNTGVCCLWIITQKHSPCNQYRHTQVLR